MSLSRNELIDLSIRTMCLGPHLNDFSPRLLKSFGRHSFVMQFRCWNTESFGGNAQERIGDPVFKLSIFLSLSLLLYFSISQFLFWRFSIYFNIFPPETRITSANEITFSSLVQFHFAPDALFTLTFASIGRLCFDLSFTPLLTPQISHPCNWLLVFWFL